MGVWDDVNYYEEEAAKEAFINDAVQNISDEGVRGYLGSNGDKIDARVQGCLRQGANSRTPVTSRRRRCLP